MNATELFHKDQTSAGIFYCGKCRVVAHSQALAEQCCQNYRCSQCGKDVGSRSWLMCDDCRRAKDQEQERKRFEAAEKVTQWDGPIHCDSASRNEGFFASLDDFEDYLAAEEAERPEYVWTCDTKQIACIDLGDIAGLMDDDAPEDFDFNELIGLPELKAALTAFNEANTASVVWTPNYKRALLIQDKPDTETIKIN